MARLRTLTIVFLLLASSFSGCIGQNDPEFGGSTPGTSTADSSEISVNSTPRTSTKPKSSVPKNKLEIQNGYGKEVTVELLEPSTGKILYRNTSDDEYINVSNQFVIGEDYRVTVYSNATWNETIYHYEGYKLLVTSNGSIEVVGVVEI